MKKIVVLVSLCLTVFSALSSALEEKAKAGNIEAAYQLAEHYEKNNDIKNAMFWYKKAAQLSLPNQDKLASITDNPTPNIVQKHENILTDREPLLNAKQTTNSNKMVSDRLAMYQDYEVNNGIFQLMDSTFGLRPYHSNYILPATYDSTSHDDGRKHVETTFQISFRKDIFTNTFGLNEAIGFAYTQRNWWQTTENSSPFRETNYLPELYVRIPNSKQASSFKGSQFDFLHESNGQGNDYGKSRSWNRLYLEGYFRYRDSFIVPRVWYKIYENRNHDDNHDIQDYLGYGDLSILFLMNSIWLNC